MTFYRFCNLKLCVLCGLCVEWFLQWTHSWVTLVTRENYNEKTGNYAYRRAIRAVFVSVEYEK